MFLAEHQEALKKTFLSPKSVDKEGPPLISNDTVTQPAKNPIRISPYTFVEDGTACFFFNDNVLDDSVVFSSIFRAMPKSYAKAPVGSAFSNTTATLGMACLSNANRTPELMAIAAPKYAAALRSINSTMTDPVKA